MNLGNRYSQHSFAQIPSVNTPRSRFDRSYAIKTTMMFDFLVPFFVEEILPGDTINLNVKTFARLATQLKPIMDNMYVDFFFFFVPNRLVWENWEKFNGARTNPTDPTDYLIPQVVSPVSTGWIAESIYDQMGLPINIPELSVNALPFRAYNLIWNEWFRDENLQQSLSVPTGDGPDNQALYTNRRRGKKHDYFTSALPWPQKGDPVSLPLGTTAPVVSTETGIYVSNMGPPVGGSYTDRPLGINASSGNSVIANGSTITINDNLVFTPGLGKTGLETDLSEATAATINALRQAFMMQSILELDARGGTRYTEILKAHFNVISPDFRLQRPELLSISSTRIEQHPVAQTSEGSDESPQANLAAFSTQANFGNRVGFSKSFVEHGFVIGLIQARADITYQQGLNKMWTRETRWDYFWPKFQELGEQAILNKEIYCQGSSADNDVFGYQERYAEYRYHPSEIRGQFRSQYAESLDVWHLAQEFDTLPTLNGTFIQNDTPIERALVVTEGYPHLLLDAWFDLKHARPMVTYGVPATLGRF